MTTAKKYAYEINPGDTITGLVLDPPGDVKVDSVICDDENSVVRVDGYIDSDGTEIAFTWGFEKSVQVLKKQ